MRRILLAFLALLFLSSSGYLEKFGLGKSHSYTSKNHSHTNYHNLNSSSAHY